jgi:hypothetical protein
MSAGGQVPGSKPGSTEEVQSAARRKTMFYVGLFMLGWLCLASIIAGIPAVRESLESGALSMKKFNHVLVRNDADVPLYFTPCVDADCNDPDNPNHPSDFNVITPGHTVDLKIEQASGGLKSFAVYGDDRERKGCVSFLTGDGAREPVNRNLSSVIEDCDRLGEEGSNQA